MPLKSRSPRPVVLKLFKAVTPSRSEFLFSTHKNKTDRQKSNYIDLQWKPLNVITSGQRLTLY